MAWNILIALELLALLAVSIGILKRQAASERRLRRAQVFDRRFALYQAVRTLLDAALVRKDLSEETLDRYRQAITAAPFILEDGLAADLADFAKSIQVVRKLREDFDQAQDLTKRMETSRRLSEEMAEISTFASQLDSRFKPLLDVRDPVI